MTSRTTRTVRKVVDSAIALARGETLRRRHARELLERCEWSEEQMQQWQLQELRRLLVHAGATVPYWRRVFRELQFRPDAIQGIDELSVLPVTTKKLLREHQAEFISEAFRSRRLVSRKTGGSTGQPLEFVVTGDEYELQMGACRRADYITGLKDGEVYTKLWGYGKPQTLGNLIAPLTGRIYLDAKDLSGDAVEAGLELMKRHDAVCLYGYASALWEYALLAERFGKKLPALRFVMSTAEKLHAHQRADIERIFGVPVRDFYGCHEVPRLASQCSKGGMHWYSDVAVAETGFTNSANENRRILITSLQSWAMPLIRYDVGDTVEWSSSTCECGLPFPTIDIEVGKEHYILQLPEGVRVHSSLLYQPLYNSIALEAFQIVQRAQAQLDVLYVAQPGQAALAATEVNEALADFRTRTTPRLKVSAREVSSIPLTPAGKRPIVRVESGRPAPESNS